MIRRVIESEGYTLLSPNISLRPSLHQRAAPFLQKTNPKTQKGSY